MAKMKRNIGDMVSGKLGNIVFVRLRDKSYIRMAPQRKPDSWSEQQLRYRERLKRVAALWRSVGKEAMKRIWNLAAPQMNGYAWFIKKNIRALSIDGQLLDPRLLWMSDGKLNRVAVTLEKDAFYPDKVRVQWLNDPHLSKQRLTDTLLVMGYGNGYFSTIIPTGLTRGDQGGTIPLPPLPLDEAVSHLYFFFESEDKGMYSESECVEV